MMTFHSRLAAPLAALLMATAAPAQQMAPATTPAPEAATPLATAPFGIGERADYDVKFGFLRAGTASMAITGVQDVRGRPALHTEFRLQGGRFGYNVDDVFESWIDRATFYSLRFYQTQQEGHKEREKRYEIYPDRVTYVEMDKDPPREHPSVHEPLDDGSFLYFIRAIPLEVGKTYSFDRYFRPDRNPVSIRVLRKESVEVPAGTFNAIVIQPVIKTSGIFSENGQAEVWLSDDDRHVVLQIKSKLTFGSINLYLKSYHPATQTATR